MNFDVGHPPALNPRVGVCQENILSDDPDFPQRETPKTTCSKPKSISACVAEAGYAGAQLQTSLGRRQLDDSQPES